MAEMNTHTMLKLPASVTFENAALCSQELAAVLTMQKGEDAEQVIVDASEVERFDSSILAVLLQCRRDAVRSNKGFQVLHMSPQLQELSKLYGVDQLL